MIYSSGLEAMLLSVEFLYLFKNDKTQKREIMSNVQVCICNYNIDEESGYCVKYATIT